jgi:hypothetical protein
MTVGGSVRSGQKGRGEEKRDQIQQGDRCTAVSLGVAGEDSATEQGQCPAAFTTFSCLVCASVFNDISRCNCSRQFTHTKQQKMTASAGCLPWLFLISSSHSHYRLAGAMNLLRTEGTLAGTRSADGSELLLTGACLLRTWVLARLLGTLYRHLWAAPKCM